MKAKRVVESSDYGLRSIKILSKTKVHENH